MKENVIFNKFVLTAVFFSLLFLIVSRSQSKPILPGEEEYLTNIEKNPVPIGGIEAIMKKIRYPEMAQKTKTEGKVYLMIFVNEGGSVDEVKVIKGIGMGCDDEAVKIIKTAKFTPGVDKGLPVKAKMSLAISFAL